jgi:predicted peroxiredoxin
MRFLTCVLLAIAVVVGSANVPSPALAGPNDPLFVNLLTEDAHRARMALTFSKNQFERGHPLTIFFNDKGVLVVSKANAEKYGEQQKMIAELIGKGAVILVCPMCMKHYGVAEGDLISGARIGNPELVGNGLFKDNTKTLTW